MSKRSHRMDENILENRVIVSLIIIFAIVVISIGYIWISNSVKSKTNLDKQIAKQDNSNEINNNSLEVDKKTNEDSESASSSIGKSVEDSKNTNDETGKTENDNSNSLTNETSNSVNNENSKANKTSDTNSNENSSTVNNSGDDNIANNIPEENNVSNTESNIQPSFIMPAEGEILKGFSKENLVFSETLQEWLTHQALDIKANSRDVVKCSADGKVKAIKSDPRYGLTVIVEHSAGFETVYSNLLTAEFVVEGEEVKQGQTLGTVGTSAVFEIADESHLHFEMLLNSEYVDPNLYINK
ncbi:MAG: peptidoglycan DD-metalloendopeptidase family protein [Clostridia bacterium]|nr:peptidoglycan DD-metalloendopeptidase family protein [Clostridia bacterium]